MCAWATRGSSAGSRPATLGRRVRYRLPVSASTCRVPVVAISDSYEHNNLQFGIRALQATKLKITTTEVAFNAVGSTNPGSTGGLKINGVIGLLLKKDYVHDNGGGAGIWLDIDSQNFQLVSNESVNNAAEEIRIETSCSGTLLSNSVGGGSIAGVDIVNSRDVTVSSNVVSAPLGALFGIRMLGNGRSTSVGTGGCMTSGAYQNVNNQAISNAVTLADAASRDGVDFNGGVSASNAWSSNSYTVPSCTAGAWQWWDGVVEQFVTFTGWQGYGQDLTGSCSSTAVGPIGSALNQTGGTVNTLTLTVGADGVPAADTVVVAIAAQGTISVTSVTDSKLNSYSSNVVNAYGGTGKCTTALYSAHLSTGLVSGDTITVTVSSGLAWGFIAEDRSGLTTTFDQSGTANSGGVSTTLASVTTAGSTSNANGAVFGLVCVAGSSTVTADPAYPNFTSVKITNGTATRVLNLESKIVSATGVQTATFTLTPAQAWSGVIGSYS